MPVPLSALERLCLHHEVYSNHLKYWCKEQPSEAGLRVAVLLDEWHGLHHFDERSLRKVDWTNPHYIMLVLDHHTSAGQLATFDFSGLTNLVFLAHDHCIRVDIAPCNMTRFKILFHPRQRDGGMSQRHPTIENALAEWRKRHPVEVTKP